MKKHCSSLLGGLFVCSQFVCIVSFATPKKHNTIATSNSNGLFSKPSIDSVIQDGNIEEVNKEFIMDYDENSGGVDRRQFFVSMVGAASVLAFAEDVHAEVVEGGRIPEPILLLDEQLSSTLLASDATISAPPTVDTRAIFNKAAKKAGNGGKGMIHIML